MKKEEYIKELNETELEMHLVFCDILKEIKPKRILEIGTGVGTSGRCFVENSDAFLDTVDASPRPMDKRGRYGFGVRMEGFENRFKKFVGKSQDIVPTLERVYDLIYIDADHSYEAVSVDLRNSWDKVKKGGVILLDDVLHIGNWIPRGGGGVPAAIREVLKEKKYPMIKIYLAGNGIGRVDL